MDIESQGTSPSRHPRDRAAATGELEQVQDPTVSHAYMESRQGLLLIFLFLFSSILASSSCLYVVNQMHKKDPTIDKDQQGKYHTIIACIPDVLLVIHYLSYQTNGFIIHQYFAAIAALMATWGFIFCFQGSQYLWNILSIVFHAFEATVLFGIYIAPSIERQNRLYEERMEKKWARESEEWTLRSQQYQINRNRRLNLNEIESKQKSDEGEG